MVDVGTLANYAEIASLAAIVGGAAFAVFQLRADRKARQDAAAFAVVQNFMQNRAFVEAAHFFLAHPAGWAERPVDAKAQRHLDEVHMTLETIGFAVHRGVVRLADVEALLGGIARKLWFAIAPLAAKDRQTSPRWYEWSEWLIERLEEARPGGADRPVATEHRPARPVSAK